MEASECKAAVLDPRIRRTRQMLQDALSKLLKEKDFEKISIQEIASAATLNRATFYDHYPDKFALLACTVERRFRELVAKRNIRFEACAGAIKSIALVVCDYLLEMVGGPSGEPRQSEASLESAIVAVVRGMILEGLTRHGVPDSTALQMLASTSAWAIYGAARDWVQTPDRMPVEEMAELIDRMVTPMLSSLWAPVT